MRSKIVERILEEMPQSIRTFVKNYANLRLMNKQDIYAKQEDGIDKWYFIGTTDGPNQIINTTKVLDTGKSEYGYINHLSPAYKTKEILIERNKILPDSCVECGGVVATHYYQSELLIKRNMCFSCSLWYDRIEESKQDRIMIVNHQWYSIGREDRINMFKGFGGAKFIFVKSGITIDSVVTESTNVWFGGDIPKHFWDRMPDNATMVKGRPPVDMSKL